MDLRYQIGRGVSELRLGWRNGWHRLRCWLSTWTLVGTTLHRSRFGGGWLLRRDGAATWYDGLCPALRAWVWR